MDECVPLVSTPLCECHGIRMIKNGVRKRGGQKWRCSMKAQRERREIRKHKASELDYRRVYLHKQACMRAKRARIAELEAQLADEIRSGDAQTSGGQDGQDPSPTQALPGSR